MDARTKGLVATIASVILCGCPGLLLCITGAAVTVGAPVTTEFNGVTNTTALPLWMGAVGLCIALILMVIPVAVGFFTLRQKPAAPATPPPSAPPAPPATDEPLPPAS